MADLVGIPFTKHLVGRDSLPSEHLFGTQPTAVDYQKLLGRHGISRRTVDAAPVRRVDDFTGREVTGNEKQKLDEHFEGLLIGSRWPGEDGTTPIRDYYLRRDRPPLEQKPDGTLKEGRKYLAAPGSYNKLILPPGTKAE